MQKPYTVTKTKHTSTGEDIWVVSLNDKISKEEFAKLRDEVKKNGGYYSRFAKTLDGKALPGFVFKSEPSVDMLAAFENDSVPTSPTAYSETEKKNWESSNSIVLYENDDQLDEFINEALDNINLNQKIYFGKIPEVTSQRIFKEAGVDVSGYNISLKKYEIRKILLNSHGDFQKEDLRGQAPITPADIKLIPQIISSPDDIRLSEKEYEGKPALEFEKEIDNKKYVVAYVSRKHHDISVITMYKKRSLATAENANALSSTSETTNSTASTDIIAPKSSDVNTESTNVKENIENEREQTGILDTESEGHPGGNVSEEAQEVEEGRDVGRNGDDGSQDSVREVREDARLAEGEQTSSDRVQYREPDTGRDFDGELREHTDSEGRSDRTSDTSSRRLNSHNYKITEDIDSKRPNITDIDSQLNFGEDNSDIVEDMNDEFEVEDDEFEHKYYIESEEKRNGIKGNFVDVRNRWRALFGTKERSETIFGEFGKIKQTSKEQRQRYSERIRRAGRYVRRIVDGFE